MKKKFISAKALKQQDKIVFIASEESPDRMDETLPVDSWDLKNFKRSPRLFVDHDHQVEKIVGVGKVYIEGKRLMLEPKFHNITELARTTKQMVEEGVLDTVSVGFLPHEDGKNELLEVSFVGIPMHPNARRVKGLEDVSEEEVVQIKGFLETEEPKEEEKVEEKNDKVDLEKVKDLENQVKELTQKTQGIEATLKSMSHSAPKQKLVKARHQAKLTAARISKLNAGFRDLLKSYK